MPPTHNCSLITWNVLYYGRREHESHCEAISGTAAMQTH